MSPSKAKANVYTLLTNLELIERVEKLNESLFNLIKINDPSEITDTLGFVFIVEKPIYLTIKNKLFINQGSMIIVTNKEINLKSSVANRIPRELFLTEYLEEFINWTLEKNNILTTKKKKKTQNSKTEKILLELKEISRCSIFTT